MKRATMMAAVLLMLLTSLASAQLASNERIVAQVPFEFMVSNTMVPAGKYTVQLTQPGTKLLTISNRDAKVGLLSRTFIDENKTATSAITMVFNKYGDQHFLREIRLKDQTIYRLPLNKSEAELLARNAPAAQEIVLASLQ
jgi:hypothetical protein